MDHNTRSPHAAVEVDGKTGWRVAFGLLLSLSVMPAMAQSTISPATPMGERVQLNGTVVHPSSVLHVTQSISEPLATAGPLPPQDALQADRTQAARQTMLWAEHARSGLGVGIGVEQRRPYGSAAMASMAGQGNQPVMEGGVLVGASLVTGPRSHLVVQTPLVNANTPRNPLIDDPQFAQDQQRQVRMGLVFNTKKPYSDLRQGLRVELSGQTTLAIKPRGGGRLGFALQKVW